MLINKDRLISTVPGILTWAPRPLELQKVESQYIALVCDALGVLLGVLYGMSSKRAATLQRLINGLDSAAARRLFCAPEITYELFYEPVGPEERADILISAIIADAIVHGRMDAAPPDIDVAVEWTATGQNANPGGARFFLGAIPVDFDSPHALRIALDYDENSGDARVSEVARFDVAGKKRVLDELSATLQAIRNTNPYIADFVHEFTKALVLRTDDERPESFASSSSGQFVGRTMLVNPTSSRVSRAMLADAMVHETIHSVLYMLERQSAWVIEDDLFFDETIRITSPWTGASLRLRPFMQACFVWFGLMNFWSEPKSIECFDREDVEYLLGRSYAGFTKGLLGANLSSVRSGIDPQVIEAIDWMQEQAAMVCE